MNYYFELLTDYFAAHPILAIGIVFIVAMGEALFIVGLVVPSTVVLVSAGTLVGMGKLDFTPVLIATILGAIAGDAISYWVGRLWERQVKAIWIFRKYTFLLASGEAFFLKHGGKSVFIGRFIPGIKAVVPGIAGIMGMNAWHFTLVNVVSAVFWSLAHLLPGVLVGRGLDVAQSSNPRLLVLLVILTVIGVSTWYSFKIVASIILPYIWKWRRRIAARLALRKSLLGKWAARILMNRGYVVTSHTYAILAFSCLLGFGILSILLLTDTEVISTDRAITSYLASLRTEVLDPLMVAIGLSGSSFVLLSVSLALCAALIMTNRWRLAGLFVGSIAFSALIVPVIKAAFGRERPLSEASNVVQSFSFPSHQATVSLVVYGLAASLVAWHLSPYIRRYIYLFFFALIAMISFSRVYLQAHWPSDILGAGLIGAAIIFVTLYLMTRVNRLNPNLHPVASWKILALVSAALFCTSAYQINFNLEAELAKSKLELVQQDLSQQAWEDMGWRNLPGSRTLFDGKVAEAMWAQTNLSKNDLRQRLTSNGWTESKVGTFATLTDSILPSRDPLSKRSVLPSTNAGRPPALVFQKGLSANSKAVLRIWTTAYSVEDRELFTFSIMQERQRFLPFAFSLIAKNEFEANTSAALMMEIESALKCRKIVRQADQRSLTLLVAK